MLQPAPMFSGGDHSVPQRPQDFEFAHVANHTHSTARQMVAASSGMAGLVPEGCVIQYKATDNEKMLCAAFACCCN
jgi:hypothetical protein